RLYPANRALRIVHGLVDLLADWKGRCDPAPWAIACDDFDLAGHLALRFFSELMRRRGGSHSLVMLATCRPGSADGLSARFESPVKILVGDLKPATPRSTSLTIPASEAGRLAQEIEDQLNGDPILAEMHLPELIRLWSASNQPERA